MKTEELISDLTKNLKPVQGADSLKFFMLKALFIAGAISLVSWIILPVREDFYSKLMDFDYYYESALWFVTSVMAVLMVYYNCIPGLSNRWLTILPPISLVLLALIIPFGSRPEVSIQQELSLIRGICGGLISIIGAAGAYFLIGWTKKHAPTNYYIAGFGIAVASASLGSLLMQFVCAHDSVMHVYIWHFIPTILAAGSGALLGRRVLHW